MHWLSLSKNLTPFIWQRGNDQTDEDLFRVMPPEAYTIRVGNNLVSGPV
jgi:trehalose-6-phosphatase